MILYTCPHCGGASLYSEDAAGDTHCRQCDRQFALSRFTRSNPDAIVRTVRVVREATRKARTSLRMIYLGASLATLVVLWFSLSVFGVIPDEIRVINRRFVITSNSVRLHEAVGLIAVGTVDDHGQPDFTGYGTAWAISNDGFMVTAKHVVHDASGYPSNRPKVGIWVYFRGKRTDAVVVWMDAIADIAVVKVAEYIPYRFRVAGEGYLDELNIPIATVGFQRMPTRVDSIVTDTELALTTGTVSRMFRDRVGTPFIEHTAPIKPGSSGGPVLLGNIVIGMNTSYESGSALAIDMMEYRPKIMRALAKYRSRTNDGND